MEECYFQLLKVTLLHGCFLGFLICKNDTKLRKYWKNNTSKKPKQKTFSTFLLIEGIQFFFFSKKKIIIIFYDIFFQWLVTFALKFFY